MPISGQTDEKYFRRALKANGLKDVSRPELDIAPKMPLEAPHELIDEVYCGHRTFIRSIFIPEPHCGIEIGLKKLGPPSDRRGWMAEIVEFIRALELRAIAIPDPV